MMSSRPTRSPADEEDVRGVHLDVLLLGMLAPALGRHVGHGALEHLQEGLLHALAGTSRVIETFWLILSISSM